MAPSVGVYRATTGSSSSSRARALYELTSDWEALLRSGVLGSSTGRVTMADDGTRLLIGDGTGTAYQPI
jgi:hypothetical protein